jgi:hypothetical protein
VERIGDPPIGVDDQHGLGLNLGERDRPDARRVSGRGRSGREQNAERKSAGGAHEAAGRERKGEAHGRFLKALRFSISLIELVYLS